MAQGGNGIITTNDTTICPGQPVTLNAVGSGISTQTDDVYSSVIPIGFNFTFYGNTYSSCLISSNGYISFNTGNANTYSAWAIGQGIPGNSAVYNSICGFYSDIYPPAGGSILYTTVGAAPNRKFIVTFCNVAMFSCNSNTCTFQMVLYETSNNIEVHIASANVPTCAWNGGYAIEGIQDGTGTNSSVVPGRNYPSVWSATNDAYQWSPTSTTSYTLTSIPFANFPSGPGNITWYANGTTYAGTGPSITVSPTTNTFYVAQTGGSTNCGTTASGSDTVYITIGSSAPPTVTTPVIYCQGDVASPLTATAAPGAQLNWYTTPATGVGGTTTAPTPGTTNTGNTTYYVSQSVGSCESPTTPITVTVNAPAAVPTATTPITYCQNATAVPLTATGSNLLWYANATGGTGGPAPTPSTTVGGSSTTYYVSQTPTGSCESARLPVTVNVTATPAAPTVTTPVTYCQNESAVPLTATGSALQYYYTLGGTPNASLTPSTANGGSSTSYYVTQTVSGCESGTATINVDVTATPAAPTVVSPITYCQNAVAVPLTATGTAIQWYTSQTGSGNANAPTPSTTTAGTVSYYVTQSTTNGCESPFATLNVTTYGTPPLPVVAPKFICQDASPVQLTAIGSNLLWYTTATGSVGTIVAPAPGTAAPGSTTYYVSQTINGCEGPRAGLVFTVNPKPAPPVVTDSIYYCQNTASVPLTANAPYGLTWYNTPFGGSGSASAPVPSTLTAGTVNYYVTQTDNNGCESNRAGLSVVTHPQVIAEIAFNKARLCLNDSLVVTYTGNTNSTAQYVWDFGDAQVHNGAGEGPYTIMWQQSGLKRVGLMVTSLGCSDTTNKTIQVDYPPTVHFDAKSDACTDELISVQAAWGSTGGDDYTWDFGGGNVAYGSGQGAYLVSWNSPGKKVITMFGQFGACTSEPTTDTITIHEKPVVTFMSTVPESICEGDTLSLFVDGKSGYTYLWGPSELLLTNGGSTAAFVARGPRYLSVTLTDAYNCKSSDSVAITTQPCCVATMPNAFTPNGDGRNDVFRIITDGHHTLNTFRIANRWGVTVFQTQDEKVGWDGIYNGVLQDMGTYYYYVKYRCNGKDFEQQGDLMLIR